MGRTLAAEEGEEILEPRELPAKLALHKLELLLLTTGKVEMAPRERHYSARAKFAAMGPPMTHMAS